MTEEQRQEFNEKLFRLLTEYKIPGGLLYYREGLDLRSCTVANNPVDYAAFNRLEGEFGKSVDAACRKVNEAGKAAGKFYGALLSEDN